MFGAHVWRRDPPCAQRRNKEYLLNNLLTTESSTPAFHSIRVVPTQVQGLALGLVEPHEVHTGPLLELVQVPLDGILSFWCVSCTTQLDVICKLAEGAPDLTKSLMKMLNSTSPSMGP